VCASNPLPKATHTFCSGAANKSSSQDDCVIAVDTGGGRERIHAQAPQLVRPNRTPRAVKNSISREEILGKLQISARRRRATPLRIVAAGIVFLKPG
jgi:hypothetical protein